ncbi:type V toxin-antitoxin system endoribonuclease antitoxin GhoS [Serratia marcescens]
MTSFTVRIELHDADSSDYDELHKKMEAGGFNTTIAGKNGTYKLPPAEYDYSSSSESCEQVRDKAYDIAKKVKKSPSVLVSEVVRRCWNNLEDA